MKAFDPGNNTARRRRSWFFPCAALLALAVVFVGFFSTFTQPMFAGTFHGPPVMFVHGAAVASWIILFAVQAGLVRVGRLPVHRKLGLLSLALVPLVVVSTEGLGAWAMQRDAAAGLGEIATSTFVGTITTPLLFTALVAAGLHFRRRPDVHRRLMWLATIAILWPAFFRFRHYFPPIARPDVWFGFVPPALLVVGSMLWDRFTVGRVHPTYVVAGTAVITESLAEVVLFDSAPWRVLAHSLADLLT